MKNLLTAKLKQNKTKKKNITLLVGSTFTPIFNETCVPLDKYLLSNSNSFNVEGMTICNAITEKCCNSVFLPKSKTIIISDDAFIGVAETVNKLVENIPDFQSGIVNETVNNMISFFDNNKVLVAPSGASSIVYKGGNLFQSAGSAWFTSTSISYAQILGFSGSQVISAQPLLLISVPTIGGIFFHGIGMLVPNTIVGKTSKVIGDICLLPMKGTELILNNLVLMPISKLTGFPLLLNYTNVLSNGPGLNITEAGKFYKNIDNSYLSKLYNKTLQIKTILFNKGV